MSAIDFLFMEIEFSLSKTDLIQHMKWRSEKVDADIRARIWAPKVFLWTALFGILFGGLYLDKKGAGVSFVYIAGLLSIIVYARWHMKSRKDILASEEHALAPQKLIVTEGALIQMKSSMKGEFLWNGIKDIVHTSTATFILMRNRGSVMVPHRIFKNSAEIQDFQRELNSRWSSARWESKSFFVPNAK